MNKIVYTQKFTKRIGQIGQKPFHIQKNFYNVLLSKFENLKIFPKMYPKIKNQYRKIPIQNYSILFSIKLKEKLFTSLILSQLSQITITKYIDDVIVQINITKWLST